MLVVLDTNPMSSVKYPSAKDLARLPHVIGKDLEAAYRQMAEEEAREAEAWEWAEGTVGDVADEPR